MVREREGNYLCGICSLAYKERKWAEKCEKWCRAHNSCSLEIARYAVR